MNVFEATLEIKLRQGPGQTGPGQAQQSQGRAVHFRRGDRVYVAPRCARVFVPDYSI